MSLIPRLIQFRAGKIVGSAVCCDPYLADTWQGWFAVEPGDVIFELDDSLSMFDYHQIIDNREMTLDVVEALTGGHVAIIPDAPATSDSDLMYRKMGRSHNGELVARYRRKEDETDMALLKRRARGETVPEIPQDEVLPIALERRLEAAKPAKVT